MLRQGLGISLEGTDTGVLCYQRKWEGFFETCGDSIAKHSKRLAPSSQSHDGVNFGLRIRKDE